MVIVALAASIFAVIGTGGAADAVDEHSHDGWTEWTSGNSLPSAAGHYYLATDVTLTATWTVNFTISLCLNGHSIVMDQADGTIRTSVIKVTSSTGFLNLYDCNPSTTSFNGITHAKVGDDTKLGCGVSVESGGTFIMEGGTIFGNKNDKGGGVAIEGDSLVKIKSGKVCNNEATGNGGGVYSESMLELSGGEISNNKSSSSGGGVYSYRASDHIRYFKMSGGTISGNTAGSGAGVYISCSSLQAHSVDNFQMTGGLITKNKGTTQGAGVCLWGGEFIMSSGVISENTTSYDGGGVYISSSSTFKMSGGKIIGNRCGGQSMNGGGICQGGTMEISGNPQITDNKDGNINSNVWLFNDRVIKVIASISSTTPSIGITDTNIASAFTSGYSGSAPYLFFFSDDSGKRVISSGNEATLTSVNLKISLDPTSFVYDGTAKIPTATVKDGSTTLTLDTHYTLSYLRGGAATTDLTSAGTITVKAIGTGEYIGKTISKNYTISQASATVTADDKEKDKWEADPEFTATVTGLYGLDTLTYMISREAGEEVGEYAIIPSGETSQGNYKVTYVPGTLIINGLLTVTFDVQGHGDAPDAQYVGYGKKVSEPKEPTAYGWKFGGWFKDSKCTSEWDFSYDTVHEDTTLYAKWTYVHYEDDDEEEVQAYLQRIAHIRAMQEAQQTEDYSEQETVMVTIAAGAVAAALLAVVMMLFRRY